MEHIQNVGVCSVCSTLAKRVFVSRSAHFRWGFRMCGFVCGCQLMGGRTPSLGVGATGNVHGAGRIDWRKKLRSRPDLSVLLSVDRQRKKAKRLWQSTARDSSSGVPTNNARSARRQIAQPMCRQESTFLLPVHSVEFSNRLSRLFKKRRRGRLMASEGTSTRNK